MRGKTTDRRPALVQALAAVAAGLDETASPWMLIGGMAVIARGVKRMTTDIDIAVRGDALTVANLLRTLGRHAVEPRIADAERFAGDNLVLLLRHAPTDVEIDLSLAWTAFEHEALTLCTPVSYGGVIVPVATAEALVVFKAIAARGKDLDDGVALLAMHPEIDLARVRHRVAQLAAAADAPELVTAFDSMLAPPRTPPTPPRRRPASSRPKATRRRPSGR